MYIERSNKYGQKMEEEKNNIALLVELDLYEKLKRLDELMEDNTNAKEEVIESFVKECMRRVHNMDEQQVREHIQFVLNRTRKNRGENER